MTDKNNSYDRFYARKDEFKNTLKNKYPSYEELLEFSTKAAIELSIGRYTFQEFINWQFLWEIHVANGSKEELEQFDDRLKNNPIYQEFKRMRSHEKMVNTWGSTKVRHKENIDYKKLVTGKWEEDRSKKDVSKIISVSKASVYYAEWLEDEYNKVYEPRTVSKWIYEYARIKDIKLR